MKTFFLSPWFPYPPHNGSKIRAFYLLRALAEAGHEVTLFSFVRPGEVADPDGLTGLCESWVTAPWQEFRPNSLRAILAYLSHKPRSLASTFSREIAWQICHVAGKVRPDVVLASQTATAEYARSLPGPRILEDLDEIPVMLEAALQPASLRSRIMRHLTWLKYRAYVRGLVQDFSCTTVVSEHDRNLLHAIAPPYTRVAMVPNGVDTERNRPEWVPKEGTLVYSGSLTYSANYDAVAYFLSSIWPRVRAQRPDTTLTITGSTKGVALDRLPLDPQIRFTGYVADIRPVVGCAWACIVPLRVGGGTRLKILEAMALGTPVVSTTKGAQGLEVTPEEHLLIADTAEDFAAQVIRLLGDPLLRHRLAENARRLVEEKYDWRQIGRHFVTVVEETVRTAYDTSRSR
ncbi:MAG: glycosyltransferase family 4 protein [Chloroflexia bacterium]